MILAAYLVTGFLVASVYAVGMLRGRRDRHHRLGLLIPLTVACDRDPDPVRGRRHRGARDRRRPAGQVRGDGVRADDLNRRDRVHRRPLHVERRQGGIGIPGLDSFLVGFSTDTKVTGLDSVPPDERPPANTMLHWAFDTMVGICTALIAPRALARSAGGAGATSRRRRGSCAPRPSPGWPRSWRSSAGWIVTEVGRQPWIVYDVMRTEDAVTGASGIWVTFSIVARCSTRRSGSRRCSSCAHGAALARGRRRRPSVPYGPDEPSRRRHRATGGAG